MREYIVSTLVLLVFLPASGQTVPPGWKIFRDAKDTCQIAVPPEWVRYSESGDTAVFHDPTTAIAVVTSQLGQAFRPLTPSMLRVINVPRDKMFENSVKRIFYQDRISSGSDVPNAYSSSVPASGGTCSCRVVFLPSISEEIARKIVLSLGPASEQTTRL